MISHPPAGSARLVHMAVAGFQHMHRIGKASGGIGWEWLAGISTAFYWSKEDTNLIDIQEAANRLHLLLEGPVQMALQGGWI